MAKQSMLERAKEEFEKFEKAELDYGTKSFHLRNAEVAGLIALADQVKRVADAQWKKIGQENKAEKE